jgi:hypothetical protein
MQCLCYVTSKTAKYCNILQNIANIMIDSSVKPVFNNHFLEPKKNCFSAYQEVLKKIVKIVVWQGSGRFLAFSVLLSQ